MRDPSWRDRHPSQEPSRIVALNDHHFEMNNNDTMMLCKSISPSHVAHR